MIVLQQMLIFFAMMLVGITLRRRHLITQENRGQLTAIVLNYTTPALLLSIDIGDPPPLSALLAALCALTLVQVALSAAGFLVPRLLRADAVEAPIYNLLCVCPNVAFMGFPLITGTFGPLAVLYLSFFSVLNTVIVFSFGIWWLGRGSPTRSARRLSLVNPCLVACLLLAGKCLLGWHFPAPVARALTMLGDISPPLSMMLIGASLAELRLKQLLRNGRAAAFAALKMVIIPALILLTCRQWLSADPELFGTVYVILALPCGVMTGMIATAVRPRGLPCASQVISLTTAAAVLTIPAVGALAGIV